MPNDPNGWVQQNWNDGGGAVLCHDACVKIGWPCWGLVYRIELRPEEESLILLIQEKSNAIKSKPLSLVVAKQLAAMILHWQTRKINWEKSKQLMWALSNMGLLSHVYDMLYNLLFDATRVYQEQYALQWKCTNRGEKHTFHHISRICNSSKARPRYGSLLCFSDDDFSSLIWATVTRSGLRYPAYSTCRLQFEQLVILIIFLIYCINSIYCLRRKISCTNRFGGEIRRWFLGRRAEQKDVDLLIPKMQKRTLCLQQPGQVPLGPSFVVAFKDFINLNSQPRENYGILACLNTLSRFVSAGRRSWTSAFHLIRGMTGSHLERHHRGRYTNLEV